MNRIARVLRIAVMLVLLVLTMWMEFHVYDFYVRGMIKADTALLVVLLIGILGCLMIGVTLIAKVPDSGGKSRKPRGAQEGTLSKAALLFVLVEYGMRKQDAEVYAGVKYKTAKIYGKDESVLEDVEKLRQRWPSLSSDVDGWESQLRDMKAFLGI